MLLKHQNILRVSIVQNIEEFGFTPKMGLGVPLLLMKIQKLILAVSRLKRRQLKQEIIISLRTTYLTLEMCIWKQNYNLYIVYTDELRI
jgi:hypothetical protein